MFFFAGNAEVSAFGGNCCFSINNIIKRRSALALLEKCLEITYVVSRHYTNKMTLTSSRSIFFRCLCRI